MDKFSFKKAVIFLIGLVIVIAGVSFFVKNSDKDTIYVDPSGEKPWELIGGGGERIYLKNGIIYAYKDDPDKEYNIVNFTLHVTSEQYKKLAFFNTPKEAEAAGFKPSKDFAQDYECWKNGKDAFECSGAAWTTNTDTQ